MSNLLKHTFMVFLSCAALFGCSEKKSLIPQNIRETSRVSFYGADMSLPFEARIGLIKDNVLEFYRRMDGIAAYTAHVPSAHEKALFMEYLRLMPPAVEKIFRERCVGLYFIDNFTGNGFTNWALDEKGRMYFTMALNSASMTRSLSETLSERERSCFIPEKGWSLSVDAGKKYKGLAYALFHEAAHAADYIAGLSPMVDPGVPASYRKNGLMRGEFEKRWVEYGKPLPAYDYKFRNMLTFYGLDGGPKISFKDSETVYAGLSGSPFISLYGSKSWAEDFAELAAFGLITGKLGQPYKVTLSFKGRQCVGLSPVVGEKALIAASVIRALEKL